MRTGILILAGIFAPLLSCRGQEKIVQNFDGMKELTTAKFQVGDKWELRWKGTDSITITVLDASGSIVAGTTAGSDGSLYEPKGGTFYLKITASPSASHVPWRVTAVEIGAAGGSSSPMAYVPPTQIPAPGPSVDAVPAFALPSATTNAAAASPAAPDSSGMTQAQARAIVLVKGDVGEGTGFLTHSADGTPVVITNIHVIFANPNLKITTTDGRQIPVLAYKGATDRDLVMMTIKDDTYTYLDLAPDIDHLVHEGDAVLTPGNSEGGEVFLDTKGEVRGIGPEKIEFSNPIYHGNSGGPVVDVASGKVIAVVEGAIKVHPSDSLDRASLGNAKSAITSAFRYFGFRIDTVPGWETYDWNRFLTESTFLEQFHFESRCLDSLMNGASYEKANLPTGTGDDEFPSARFYQQDERLKTAMGNFRQQAINADNSQQMDAGRELYSDLIDIADTHLDEVRKPGNFYHFDQVRAKEELAYRAELRKELEKVGDHLSELGH
jgi:S1-C subfamily serine protease